MRIPIWFRIFASFHINIVTILLQFIVLLKEHLRCRETHLVEVPMGLCSTVPGQVGEVRDIVQSTHLRFDLNVTSLTSCLTAGLRCLAYCLVWWLCSLSCVRLEYLHDPLRKFQSVKVEEAVQSCVRTFLTSFWLGWSTRTLRVGYISAPTWSLMPYTLSRTLCISFLRSGLVPCWGYASPHCCNCWNSNLLYAIVGKWGFHRVSASFPCSFLRILHCISLHHCKAILGLGMGFPVFGFARWLSCSSFSTVMLYQS